MMAKVEAEARDISRRVRKYEFRSFAIGLTLPEGVQEREDEFRSNLKLQGKETIRAQAARMIGGLVALTTRKRLDRQRPDLTAVVDMADGVISISSKPVFFYGRYTKPSGIAQKREVCDACRGRGCGTCHMSGFDRGPSVENEFRKKLSLKCGTDRMKFTWLGSEDRDSRVLDPGRPFVVELKNPVRRKIPKRFAVRSGGRLVRVSKGKMLPSKPVRLPSFVFRTIIRASYSGALGADALAEIRRRFRRAVVRFDRPHDRPTSKIVYLARARKRGRDLVIEAVLDGGLPVKRFVSGELVSPSVSEVLKTEVRCRTFDICEVKETGKFGFAKITRL
jgi:tRNA pseudouridine synthase 10